MNAELVLEVGTEEIPSGYLKSALSELKHLAEKRFQDNRIGITGSLYTYGTPRRLVLIGEGISEKQEDLKQGFKGPPKGVAYDKKGMPTKAAIAFAQKHGCTPDEIGFIETPKGEYLYIKRRILGRRTSEVLKDVLPGLIADIPWPKSMRWGDVNFSFVRPIHWVLCILNGEVIPFEIAGVRSGNITYGHRFMAPHPVEVFSVRDYLEKTRKAFVIVDHQERERLVEKAAKEAAGTVRGSPAEDPELITTVTNLVEYPSAVCGGFDDNFLSLPDPALITAMREHQKYFAVYDENGELMPKFVAVNNTIPKDDGVVRRGHERVLRARLSDASFFFKEDQRRPLADRLDDLRDVIYQAELGTSFDKVQRFTRLSEYLCRELVPDKLDKVRISARLCKCDLVTHMVTEFPSLQGVMGKEYAMLEGYPKEICMAIYEHYLPATSGGRLPKSEIGAIVGLADRMDTITGCFAVGLTPSGSADPFALRRHALAIIRILEGMGWDLSLRSFIRKSLAILSEKIDLDGDRIYSVVMEFFKERYRHMMLRSGYQSDFIDAVISAAFDRICELRLRIEALKKFCSESEGFHDLALAIKRVSNILKKQKEGFDIDPALFTEGCEFTLWEAYQDLKGEFIEALEKGDYYEAFSLLTRITRPVNGFFDGVEILTKDNPALRENRVGLLQRLERLFISVADFSKLSI
jgi:glycyl-tRNA synthetase beta chain